MAGLSGEGGIPTITAPSFDGGASGGNSNKELMAEARESLSGNWGMAVLGYFLYGLLSSSISFFIFASAMFVGVVSGLSGGDAEQAGSSVSVVAQIFQFLISGPLLVGFYGYYLGIAQDDEGRLELLFVGFRRFWKSFAVYFMTTLFTLLWMLLFIIPGIIAAFRYSMAYLCIADDEGCGPMEAIRLSKEMMKGNKWKFFCLNCRFIGWSLLAALFTFGIGFLWVVPYIQTAYAKFYEDVK